MAALVETAAEAGASRALAAAAPVEPVAQAPSGALPAVEETEEAAEEEAVAAPVSRPAPMVLSIVSDANASSFASPRAMPSAGQENAPASQPSGALKRKAPQSAREAQAEAKAIMRLRA